MDSLSLAALGGGAAMAALGAVLWVRSRISLAASQAQLAERTQILEEEKAAQERTRRELDEREQSINRSESQINEAITRAAEMSPEAAKAELIAQIRREAADEAESLIESDQAEIEDRVRRNLSTAMERMAAKTASDSTTTLVPLPSEEMKGRLIGREGRNIRAFEQITGVDLIIDDTPEAVVLSSFDPLRREAARITLVNLILDGRIHPPRIEELHAQALSELKRVQLEAGKRAADEGGVQGLPAPVLDVLGGLQFRTSYAQNVLAHSVETAILCAMVADEIGVDPEPARRAGLLHDIGKALGPEWEGSHAIAGMNFLKRHKESDPVLHAVGAHHHEIEPESTLAFIVIVADSLSASRPGARRESLDKYIKRIEELEKIAQEHAGVERAFALHAGREIRVLVQPDKVSDENAKDMARRIARQISQSSSFSGQIKVTVIRETRASETTN